MKFCQELIMFHALQALDKFLNCLLKHNLNGMSQARFLSVFGKFEVLISFCMAEQLRKCFLLLKKLLSLIRFATEYVWKGNQDWCFIIPLSISSIIPSPARHGISSLRKRQKVKTLMMINRWNTILGKEKFLC